MTPKQCRMARIACDMSRDDLAARSGVAEISIRRFEQEWHRDGSEMAPILRTVLEKAGIEFIGTDCVRFPDQWNSRQQAA